MKKWFLFLLPALMASTALAADPAGYLFVTFVGEGSAKGEQIYFGLSQDGTHWDGLNANEPVLTSELGEKGVRDPYLLRAEDGKFYIVATDLSIFHHPDWRRAAQKGSRSLLIWESGDLAHWSAPRLVEVAPPDAGCTWAPEAIYDAASQRYLVYWASTSAKDEYRQHRILGAWTKDFRSFGEPFVYIEKPTGIIDTDIVHGTDGKYYRFTKDEKFKAITMESSDSVTGNWQEVPGFSLAKLKGYEGPACFQIKAAESGRPASWCLLLDAFAKGTGYQPFIAADLAGGDFRPAEGFRFPFRFRHGSVLALTPEECARLKAAFPGATNANPKTASQDG